MLEFVSLLLVRSFSSRLESALNEGDCVLAMGFLGLLEMFRHQSEDDFI